MPPILALSWKCLAEIAIYTIASDSTTGVLSLSTQLKRWRERQPRKYDGVMKRCLCVATGHSASTIASQRVFKSFVRCLAACVKLEHDRFVIRLDCE